MPLHTFSNFKLMRRHRKELRGDPKVRGSRPWSTWLMRKFVTGEWDVHPSFPIFLCPCRPPGHLSAEWRVQLRRRSAVLKVFSHSSHTNPITVKSSPTKIANDKCKNFPLPTVNKQWTIMNQTNSFITSVTAVKAAFTCKLLRLLPDRLMVRLVMELVGNRSFTLATANGKRSRLPLLKNGVPQGFVLALFLFNIYTSSLPTTLSRTYAYANDLAIMHADGG